MIACTPVFTAALETARVPARDERIQKVWDLHRGIVSSYKEREILAFLTTWVDLEGVTLR